MPQDLHRTITALMTAYAARPADKGLTPLTTAEQLEAWRHATAAAMDSETMEAVTDSLSMMVSEAKKLRNADSAGLSARIVTGFRRDELPLSEKPEPMLLELTCEGHIAGYIRLPDRPLRVTLPDYGSEAGVQWTSLEVLGHAMACVANYEQHMMSRNTTLGEWMTNFDKVAGHYANGDFTSIGGEILATLTRQGSDQPHSWMLLQPNGNYVTETSHGASREEFGNDIAGAALELMAGYDAQGGTVRVLSDDESVMAAFVAEGYEQEPAITPSP